MIITASQNDAALQQFESYMGKPQKVICTKTHHCLREVLSKKYSIARERNKERKSKSRENAKEEKEEKETRNRNKETQEKKRMNERMKEIRKKECKQTSFKKESKKETCAKSKNQCVVELKLSN